jgi:ferrous iron transport protein A
LETKDHARVLIQNLARVVEGDADGGIVPLSFLSPHQSGVVHRLGGGHEFISRMAALGFIPGAPVKIVQNFGVGPLIVLVRDTRIALGREEARKVKVQSTQSDMDGHGRHRHRREGDFE